MFANYCAQGFYLRTALLKQMFMHHFQLQYQVTNSVPCYVRKNYSPFCRFILILIHCIFFSHLKDQYTEHIGRYCFTSWATGDWDNRVVGKTVDECKDMCTSTPGCTMITHGTYNYIENNCVLCTSGSTQSTNLHSASWTTTYSRISITKYRDIIKCIPFYSIVTF